MSQHYFYPPSGAGSANASVGVNGAPITGSSTLVAGENPSGNQQPLQTDAAGNLLVNIASGSGPDDVNLVSVSGAAITLGQKTSAASLPIVIASDQSALSVSAAQSGAWTVAVNNFPATQPVSGTVTVLQGTSPWVVDASGFPVPVTGPLTDTQLRATPVPISGTVTANAGTGTFAISAASLPLPTGASTEATLSALNAKFNSLGQKTMANSAPVVIASDQTSIPVAATPTTTSGTVTQAAVAVGTTAVRCTVTGAAPNAARKALIVEPDSTSTANFYIGSSSVTSSGGTRGIRLAPGAQFIADFDASDFYIISDTAAQTFFVVEEV